MDQITMLQSPEENAYHFIRDSLVETLRSNGLDESFLTLESRKNYFSVLFDNTSVVVRIISKPASISVPSSILQSLEGRCAWAKNSRGGYSKIELGNLDHISEYSSMLEGILQGIIDRLPKEFDCCSRYMECSNATRCTHPDKRFALQCGYRKILRSGRIFYGENRNID